MECIQYGGITLSNPIHTVYQFTQYIRSSQVTDLPGGKAGAGVLGLSFSDFAETLFFCTFLGSFPTLLKELLARLAVKGKIG